MTLRRGAAMLGFVLVMPAAAVPAFCGAVEVEVSIPVPEKVDTTGMKRLLVGGFRAGSHPGVDVDRELIDALRALFRKRSRFEVIDVEPLPLPEQPIEDAVRNTAYWKRLATRYNADLIIGGTVDFGSTDQSGFVDQDYISDLTGHRQRQTVWVERESYGLTLGIYFFRGSSGELIYEDHLAEEMMFAGKSNDALDVFHQVIGAIGEGIISIVTPRTRTETRYLFTE